MPVDLADLIDSLKREVNPPGSNLYPNARDDEWLGHLADAFWEARLNGLLPGFTEQDGVLASVPAGGADLGRDLQQLIVLWAGYRVSLGKLSSLRTAFRAAAGNAQFEYQQSATVARDVLAAIKDRLKPIVDNLKAGGAKGALVMDAVIERTYGEAMNEQWWLRG